jgi:hypothetical protein
VEYFTPRDRPYGLTYGEWTAKWWQWLLAISRDCNPALDELGNNIQTLQANLDVVFLTGTFVNSIETPHRKVKLTSSRAILIPAINYQANFLEDSNLKNERELIEFVSRDIDDIVLHKITVDGQAIPTYRVASEPPVFAVNIAADLPHGINGKDSGGFVGPGGITQASSDGYWAFLKPLSSGIHKVRLIGSCAGGARRTEAYYIVEII